MEPHLVRMGLSERTVILPSFSRSRTNTENSFIIVQYNACHGNFILAVFYRRVGANRMTDAASKQQSLTAEKTRGCETPLAPPPC